MTERTALILALTTVIAVAVAVLGGLTLLGAKSGILVSAYVLILGGSSFGLSLVAIHYHPGERDRR